MKLPIITIEKLKLLIQPLSVKSNSIQKADNGFTLIEMIVVMLIIAILSAIAAPSWVALINRTRLNDAQDRVYQAITKAQKEARLKKIPRAVIISVDKNADGQDILKWGFFTKKSELSSSFVWPESIELPGIKLDETNTNFDTPANPKMRYILFDQKGQLIVFGSDGTPDINTNPTTPQKITLTIDNSSAKRCVIAQTVLGAMTTDKDDNCTK